jgi:branched-chain amino acid transport system substrate-binding protein
MTVAAPPDQPSALRRHLLKQGLSLGLAPALACLSACQRQQTIKVGFLGGLSGRVSDLAIEGRNGAQLAVELANAAGGVLGQPIELIVRDDQQKQDAAMQAFNDLADKQVVFVVGPMTSQMAVAVAPLAATRHLPLISPTATTHDLSGQVDDFFRVAPDAITGARQQADYLLAHRARSLVTIADARNKAFSDSWANGVAERFKAGGGQVLAQLSFQSGGDNDLTALASKATGHKAQVIVIVAGAVDAALIAARLRKLDSHVQLATAPWAGTEQLIELGGKAIDGTLVPQYFDRDSPTPAYQQFVARYRSRYGETPGFPATNAYDAMNVGLVALAKAPNTFGLTEVLQRPQTYPGLQHPISLDAQGDSAGLLYLTLVKDGHFVAAGN